MGTKRLALTALTLIPLVSGAQELASPTDLKAMYCLGINQSLVASIESLTNTDAERVAVAKIRQNIDRLRAYLVPRIFSLDELALLAAKNRAAEDQRSMQAEADVCIKSCGAPSPANQETFLACLGGCIDKPSPAAQRLRSCNDMSWLPF